jgi:hypothetical protein
MGVRQLWPRDQTELYFLLGALNCLMAVAASDLGYMQAGEELVRAASASGHHHSSGRGEPCRPLPQS